MIPAALAGLPGSLTAQAADPIRPIRFEASPRLDGRLDPIWMDADPLPVTIYEPVFGADAGEETEIRVGYDKEFFWIAARMYDDEPSQVRSNSLYRDRESGDDAIGVVLDAFDDNENGLWFSTNPAGVRFDRAISRDGEAGFGTPPVNPAWDAFWDVATERTEDGWTAEFRIPFSSLGFESEDDRVRMGFMAYRYIARKNERHTFPAIPPDWPMGYVKPSLAHPIDLEAIDPARPLYVTPYVLAGERRQTVRNSEDDGFRGERSSEREVGLDLKVNLTSNLVLDLTANTDFAQVEADDAQINLTRFNLFFPEKRAFFQQRAGIFEFRTGGQDRLFHSRRIGLQGGAPVPILVGARAVGRLGTWDVGGLNVVTGNTGALSPENFTVLRVRRRVVNPFSYAGALLTGRLDGQGGYNVAAGWDASIRFGDFDYLTFQVVGTADEEPIGKGGWRPLRAAMARVQFDRRSPRGLGFTVQAQRMGEDFRADMGFFQRSDFSRLQGRLGWGWIPSAESGFRSILYNVLFADAFLRNGDGGLETLFTGSMFNFQRRSGASGWFGVQGQIEDLERALEFPLDAAVPVGRYAFLRGVVSLSTSRRRRVSATVRGRAGRFYDGRRVGIGVTPAWNVSRHLELGVDYEFDHVSFPARMQGFDSHIARLRAQAALDRHLSVALFVQYDNVEGQLQPNVRIRYNFREGRDLWLVYDEGFDLERRTDDLMRPRSVRRNLLLKLTYTFGS